MQMKINSQFDALAAVLPHHLVSRAAVEEKGKGHMRYNLLNKHGSAADSADASLDQSVSSMQPALVSTAVPASLEKVALAGSGLVFINTYGSGVSDAFHTAIIAAENYFQSHFTDSATITASFDLEALDARYASENYYYPVKVSYDDLTAALAKHAATADDEAAIASLPTSDPSKGQGFGVPVGMAQVLGLAGAGSSTNIDDTIVLNDAFSWSYTQDAIGAIEHELSEGALGRVGGLGIQNNMWGPMDLFRYSASGTRDLTGGQDGKPTYFSIDGKTMLTQFHNSIDATGTFDDFDLADWDMTAGDSFGPGGPGAPGTMSDTDLRVMDTLGWTPKAAPPAPAPPAPPPTATHHFAVQNTTTGVSGGSDGVSYSGPVAGLQWQYINVTSDSLNITAHMPNVFIKSGSGNDALNIEATSGRNVLNGSTGSNFMVGSKDPTSQDTYFVDDRQAVADIWTTIVNAHKGDDATVWGVTKADFQLAWVDGEGATGYTGLTLHAVAPSKPVASLTLAGCTKADLNNGRLGIGFGTTTDGNNYMQVKVAG